MRHFIHSHFAPRTPSILLGLFLLASATSALAQDKPKSRNGRLGIKDRIESNSKRTEFLKPIQHIQVTPLCLGAIFDFDTRDVANPIIRIGKSAPTQQPMGRDQQLRWTFAPEDELSAFNTPRPQNTGTITHTLRLQTVLAPNTRYHYIIEAVSGGRLVQEIGNFSTITRRVKVVYQKVRLLRGGDVTGTGDTMFQFFVNYDAKTNRNFVWLGGRTTPLHIPYGESVTANKTFAINNVDELHLAVNGYDEDFLAVGAPPSSGHSNSIQQSYPSQGAGHTSAGAINVAKSDFDLTKSPPGPRAITIPFKLTSLSLPYDSDGQDIAFEVTGTYTILPSPFGSTIGDSLKDKIDVLNTPKVVPPTPPYPRSTGPILRRGTIVMPQR